MPLALLEVRQLRFGWPGHAEDTLALEGFELQAGQRLFLHGPSGCGKSTLLALLAGVLVPREGRVRLLGQEWAALAAARRDGHRAEHVGVIFQQFNLLPYLSVLDNVLLPCRFSSRRAARCAGGPRAAAEGLLRQVALPGALWARPARELSVGQQQRVAAARALIGAPELVIADEPTSALDEELRDGFMSLLLAECRAGGAALVFVSHDRRLAAPFDRQLDLRALNLAAPAARAGAEPAGAEPAGAAAVTAAHPAQPTKPA
ncbi:MAG: ATP-binding cassette domain-containing protein [Rubrivivax sp.]|nr:ATP-binding cassette domain-containing protein [Rubrivivax sp.]